ncbi:MAG: nickel-dependent hydrogenase large subunit [Sulfolobales archaeon]|nr:nickel-dependent hydrogenase large subunit [Sulfolobales archaeon]MDW8082334.1 nickel-dependent hydrogenase large subunit [Sulfolobales archaeon]
MRGFESLVIGRDIGEVPLIASRICGVCSHPHFWAAAIAAEQIAGVETSKDIAELRDICNKLGLVQNHVIHLGVLAAPDHIGKNELDYITKITLEINSYVTKAIRLICGRLTSPNNYFMGRFFTYINSRVLKSAVELLRASKPLLEDLTAKILDIKLPEIADPAPFYAALTESVKTTIPRSPPYYLDTPNGNVYVTSDNYREVFKERRTDYSNSRKCLFIDEVFHVGSRARLLSTLKNGGLDSSEREYVVRYAGVLKENPYSNIYAKALESRIVLDSLIQSIDELSHRELKLEPVLTNKVASAGLGVVEAPRGLLIHYYEVSRDRRVTRADIVTPTVMNTEHIELSATALVRKLITDSASEEAIRKLVESLVRAYDPCIPCAVHIVRGVE